MPRRTKPKPPQPLEDAAVSDYKRNVGVRIRQAYEALGIPQKKAAEVMGISPSHLGNWTRGDHYPDPFQLKKFCDRYNVTFDWVFRAEVAAMAGNVGDALWAVKQASSEAPEAVTPQAQEKRAVS